MDRNIISAVGHIAGICTTVSFLPQIIKVLRTRHVRDISLAMFVVLGTGIFLWLLYGIMLGEMPIILANTVSFVFCCTIIFYKLRYGRR